MTDLCDSKDITFIIMIIEVTTPSLSIQEEYGEGNKEEGLKAENTSLPLSMTQLQL